MASVRLIGYWRNDYGERTWPVAQDFVDHDWSAPLREMVASYLARGQTLQRYRGLSRCRFCECNNGSQELTDGIYCWPEGLAHYVSMHSVRLPEEFVAHVESRWSAVEGVDAPPFDGLGQRSRDVRFDSEYEKWHTTGMESFGTPDWSPGPNNWLDAEIEWDWWMRQAHGTTP